MPLSADLQRITREWAPRFECPECPFCTDDKDRWLEHGSWHLFKLITGYWKTLSDKEARTYRRRFHRFTEDNKNKS